MLFRSRSVFTCGRGILLALAIAWGGPALGAPPEKPLEAKLVDLEGEPVLLSDLRGQPLLLKFWATWCHPCREQERVVVELRDEIEAAGYRILAIDTAESLKTVIRFLAEHPTEFEVLLDRGQSLAAQAGVGELPAIVTLDGDGKPLAIHLGLADSNQVRGLLAATPR